MLALEGPPGAGPGLSRADLDWCVDLYAAPAERREPSASPGLTRALSDGRPALDELATATRDVCQEPGKGNDDASLAKPCA